MMNGSTQAEQLLIRIHEDKKELPEGWKRKKLGDFLTLEYGKPLEKDKRNVNGKYSVYGANGVKAKSDYYYYDKPSIIVGRKGSVGEVNLTDEKFWPLDVTYFIKFDEKENDLFFLYHLLLNLQLQKFAKGVKPGLNRNDVYSISVLLPPLSEQKRIVSILDEDFAAIDKAKANAQKNLANAKELFESYLNGIFSNPEKDWEKKRLGEVCKEIFAGGDAPKINFSQGKTVKYNIPIYANAVKNSGLYGYTDIARVLEPSITVAARGSGTGHTEIRLKPFLPIVRLIVLIPNTEVVNLTFLKFVVDRLTILRSGSAIPQLTVPMIGDYFVSFPKLSDQKRIIAELDALKSETKQLESIYQQKIAALDELKKSILKKTFEGEL